jgi:hypothetical protein
VAVIVRVVILLVGVLIAVVVLVVAVVILVAELVFDYLVSEMQNFHVPDSVVALAIVLVPEHADLRLIPTIARRGGITCGIRSGHGAGACSTRRIRGARTCRGARRICRTRGGARGICRTSGAGSGACGCSRGICRARSRTCSGVRRSRGARAGGIRSACGCSRGIGRGTRRIGRTRGGARRIRGACPGGTRRGARSRTCSGVRRSRGARGGLLDTCALFISVI